MALRNLQKADAPTATKEKGVVKPKAKTKKSEKVKKTPEELKEIRKNNLKPREKDPKRAALEEKVTGAIDELLQKNPDGLLVEELVAEIFDPTEDKDDLKKQGKLVRAMARKMGCPRLDIENTRKKRYLHPSIATK